MSFYSKIAQVMMNLSPNFPLYNEIGFKQEDFKNPSFTSLSKRGKNEQISKWIINDINKYNKFQFEKYFPEFQYEKYFKGKTVLDVGCSIGGLTIHFGEEYKVEYYLVLLRQLVLYNQLYQCHMFLDHFCFFSLFPSFFQYQVKFSLIDPETSLSDQI